MNKDSQRKIGKLIKSKEIICPIRMVNVNTNSPEGTGMDDNSNYNYSIWLTMLLEFPNGTAKAVSVPMRDKTRYSYDTKTEFPASSHESDNIHWTDNESYAKVNVELWENKSENETSIVINFIEAYLNRNI